MIWQEYFKGNKSVTAVVVLNVIAIAVVTQVYETLISTGVLPKFDHPGNIAEILIFISYFVLIIPFDFAVWRCSKNAKNIFTKYLSRLFATKSAILLAIALITWV